MLLGAIALVVVYLTTFWFWLIYEVGFELDAGELKNAKYLEAMAQLNIQIAYGLGVGTDVAFHYMRR